MQPSRTFLPGLVVLSLCAACSDGGANPKARGAYTGPSPQKLSCVPNLDGQIDASELQPAIGVTLSYLVSPAGTQRMVDVAGAVDAKGNHYWDMSVDYASDQLARIEPMKIAGKWYEKSFPKDAFVAPFDAAGSIEQILSEDDQAVHLLGLASKKKDPSDGQTLLVYQQPVSLLKFPLKPGEKFTSTGTIVNGMLHGLPYAGKDTYEVSDDATGELKLPQLTFTQVHRVRTKLTNEPAAGTSTTQEQVSFYFECFSEVARITSLQNETKKDFTKASEVRRLGFSD